MLQAGRAALYVSEIVVAHKLNERSAAKMAANRAQDLGPSFVKLGQFASTRADILPSAYCDEFARLRDDTLQDPPEVVKKNVKSFLGVDKLTDVFCEFDDAPIASASVAQVHKARLRKNGKEVAVKVLKDGIKEAIDRDLRAASSLLSMLPNNSSKGMLTTTIDRYGDFLRKETDLVTEANRAMSARKLLRKKVGRDIVIPRPFLSRDGVIVMEYVPSRPISESSDPEKTTDVIMETMFILISSGSWFHQDPHEGNLGIVKPGMDERVVLYDFGNVARLTDNAMDCIMESSWALLRKDEKHLKDIMLKYDLVSLKDGGSDALQTMIRQSLDYIHSMDLRSFDVSQIDRESAHAVEFKPEINNVMRAIVMAEGGSNSMPKSRGPGGKNRKKAKGSSLDTRRELVFAEDGCLYAFVSESLGDGHYRLVCGDGVERMGVLRGKMWRRVWVHRNDIVLASIREYQNTKADIIHKYMSDEVNRLIALNEITATVSRHYSNGEYDPDADDASDDVMFDEDASIDHI